MCGIGAAYNSENLIRELYTLGISLQHRGQESAGIAAYTGDIIVLKEYGSVDDVFKNLIGKVDFKARHGIVHNRYSTTGESRKINAQPIKKGNVAIAHQGNLVNTEELRKKYSKYRFETTTDSEVIAHIFADNDLKEAAEKCYSECVGSYNLVILNEKGELGIFRDPKAFHPLFFGLKNDSVYAASEDIALTALGIYDTRYQREVKPGELIIVSENGIESHIIGNERLQRCYFEPIYFMKHGSTHKGMIVEDIRIALGELLAEKYPVDADIIVPVYMSGITYSEGFHRKTGMPIENILVNNPYVGRTYISPEGKGEEISDILKMTRVEKSSLKNLPVVQKTKGKRIVIVEDSFVRGNVSTATAKTLFDAGAEEVHFRVASPPIRYPCFFGMDHATRRELIAAPYSDNEVGYAVANIIADRIGVDKKRISVNYLSIEDIKEILKDEDDHCFACLNGEFLCDLPKTESVLKALEL